jgi:hypothetical protein
MHAASTDPSQQASETFQTALLRRMLLLADEYSDTPLTLAIKTHAAMKVCPNKGSLVAIAGNISTHLHELPPTSSIHGVDTAHSVGGAITVTACTHARCTR